MKGGVLHGPTEGRLWKKETVYPSTHQVPGLLVVAVTLSTFRGKAPAASLAP